MGVTTLSSVLLLLSFCRFDVIQFFYFVKAVNKRLRWRLGGGFHAETELGVIGVGVKAKMMVVGDFTKAPLPPSSTVQFVTVLYSSEQKTLVWLAFPLPIVPLLGKAVWRIVWSVM